jgi:hypothetical protein
MRHDRWRASCSRRCRQKGRSSAMWSNRPGKECPLFRDGASARRPRRRIVTKAHTPGFAGGNVPCEQDGTDGIAVISRDWTKAIVSEHRAKACFRVTRRPLKRLNVPRPKKKAAHAGSQGSTRWNAVQPMICRYKSSVSGMGLSPSSSRRIRLQVWYCQMAAARSPRRW